MQTERSIATILFTDIVGSTERIAELGDQGWRELLQQHNEVVRRELTRFQGREIATAGDGFLAFFDDTACAILCATAIRDAIRELGLEIRCGLHMGQVQRGSSGGVGGISVRVGAQVAEQAKAGEVLVTSGVRDVELGSEIVFEDRGRHELEGMPGQWRLFAVTNVPGARAPLSQRVWGLRRLPQRVGVVGIVLALVVGMTGLYLVTRDRNESLGPGPEIGEGTHGVAVLPFRVQGLDLDLWREGMMDLLSTGLDGAAGLRTIDSRTLMARWDERVSATTTPDLAALLQVAAATGARYALVGSAVAVGEHVRLRADVYDVETNERLGQGVAEGAPQDVLPVVDRLAVEVLRVILERGEEELPEIDLESLTTGSPEALQAFLEGEVHFRHFDMSAARDAFNLALEADSSFGLAHYRMAKIHEWLPLFNRTLRDRHYQYAARLADRLPPREAVLVRAARAKTRLSLDGVEPLREAIQTYPDNAEVWYQLGDTYMHVTSALAAVEEIDRMFERAVELDPGNAEYLVHHVQFAWEIHADSARAARLLEMFEQAAPEAPIAVGGRTALDLAFGDSVAHREAVARLHTMELDVLRSVARLLAHPRYAAYKIVRRELYTRGDEVQKNLATFSLFMDDALWHGRLQEALPWLDDPAMFRSQRALAAYWAFAAGLPVPEETLDRALEPLDRSDIGEGEAVFYAGAFAADRSRWPDHSSAIDLLEQHEERALEEADSIAAQQLAGLAKALQGYGLWRRGQTAGAVALFEDPQVRGFWIVRWWLGQLYQEMGRFEDAERALNSYGYVRTLSVQPYFYSALSHEPLVQNQLGRVYEALGEDDKAYESYEEFIENWQDADPELQPMVEEARQAIIRLEGLRRE
jgi:class 3 adenylate cyclase/tetratricopeptide (TPR) repeat protein